MRIRELARTGGARDATDRAVERCLESEREMIRAVAPMMRLVGS
jgi:hypothetical protein